MGNGLFNGCGYGGSPVSYQFFSCKRAWETANGKTAQPSNVDNVVFGIPWNRVVGLRHKIEAGNGKESQEEEKQGPKPK